MATIQSDVLASLPDFDAEALSTAEVGDWFMHESYSPLASDRDCQLAVVVETAETIETILGVDGERACDVSASSSIRPFNMYVVRVVDES